MMLEQGREWGTGTEGLDVHVARRCKLAAAQIHRLYKTPSTDSSNLRASGSSRRPRRSQRKGDSGGSKSMPAPSLPGRPPGF